MDQREQILFWIKAAIVAFIACLMSNLVDYWLYPYSSVKVMNIADSTTPSKEIKSYGPTEAYKHDWCKRDRGCKAMAETLVYEARGESMVGAYAVAHVIMERVNADRWPDTIEGVVNYRCHFSWKCEKPQRNVVRVDWDRAYTVSYDVIHGLVENPAPGADHYLNPNEVKRMPNWTKEYEYVVDIDNHRFYRSN